MFAAELMELSRVFNPAFDGNRHIPAVATEPIRPGRGRRASGSTRFWRLSTTVTVARGNRWPSYCARALTTFGQVHNPGLCRLGLQAEFGNSVVNRASAASVCRRECMKATEITSLNTVAVDSYVPFRPTGKPTDPARTSMRPQRRAQRILNVTCQHWGRSGRPGYLR